MSESKEQKEQFETAEMPQVENKDSGKIDVMVELLQRKEDLQGSIENYLRDFGNCLHIFRGWFVNLFFLLISDKISLPKKKLETLKYNASH